MSDFAEKKSPPPPQNLLVEAPQTRIHESKVDKWLTRDYETLTHHVLQEDPITSLFGQAAIPALIRSGQGFVGEAGDIKVCLGLSLNETTGGKTVSVLCLGEEGKMEVRLEAKDPEANLLFQAFVTDFPRALITTDEGKPLCLFHGKGKARNFIGYLNLHEFREARRRKYKDVTVGVP